MKVKVYVCHSPQRLEEILNEIGYENVLNVLYAETISEKLVTSFRQSYTVIYIDRKQSIKT